MSMDIRGLKKGAFALEAINSLATTYYAFYAYFYTSAKFGFGNKQNLLLAAASGFVYMFGASYGGKLGQRRGYLSALRTGYALMGISLAVGIFVEDMAWHGVIFVVSTIGMSFTWPNLEALVSEGDSGRPLQRLLGIYNLVWSSFGAFAYFSGGAMLERFGLKSMFVVPVALHALQWLIAWKLERATKGIGRAQEKEEIGTEAPHEGPTELAKVFLKLAWVANPFAYVAMNTSLAMIPGLAVKLDLSQMAAGVFGSLWMFTRFASFYVFGRWNGWHYRFGWLLGSYVVMVLSFAAILLSTNFVVLTLTQAAFGVAVGLIYSSSLFYSMDGGEEKGEHGGFHEAAIGAGNCLGPLIGAGALWLRPGEPRGTAWAVTVLLGLGVVSLLAIRRAGRRTEG